MKILKSESYKKLAQWGPRYNLPKELESPDKEIADSFTQKSANYAWVKAMSGMNLAELSGFQQEKVYRVVEMFREDLERGQTDPEAAQQYSLEAESLKDNHIALMEFFKKNSPIPGSHSEFRRQEEIRDHLINRDESRRGHKQREWME